MIPLRKVQEELMERGVNTMEVKYEIESQAPENLNEDKRVE